mgnify:CR=1 FL=1
MNRKLALPLLLWAFLMGACTGTQEALPPKALAVATENGVTFVQTVVEDGAFQSYAPLDHTLDLPGSVEILDIDAYGARDRTLVVLYEVSETQGAVRRLAFFPIGRVAVSQPAVTYTAASTLNLEDLASNTARTANCARRVSVDPSGRYVGLRTSDELEGCEEKEPLHLWLDRESDGPTFNLLWDSSGNPIVASAPAWLDLGDNEPSVTWAERTDVYAEGVGEDGPGEQDVALDAGSWSGSAVDYHAAGRVGVATDGTRLVRVDWATGASAAPIDRTDLGIDAIARVRVEPNLPGSVVVVQSPFRGYLTDLEDASRGLPALASSAAFTIDTLDYLHALNGTRLEAWDLINPLNPQQVTNRTLTVTGTPVGVAWFFTETEIAP